MMAPGIALLAAALKHAFDDSRYFPWDIEQALGIPCGGTIPSVRDMPIDIHDPQWTRRLAATVERLGERGRSIAWVGCEAGIGKSTTLAVTAVETAHGGRRILVVDADVLHPSLAKIFNVEQVGTPCWNDGSAPDWRTTLRVCAKSGVTVLPALRRESMAGYGDVRRIIEEARREFDLVLVDIPAVQHIPQALELAGTCDGSVLVFGTCFTTLSTFKEKVADPLRAKALGFIMTDPRGRATETYYYYYNFHKGDSCTSLARGFASSKNVCRRLP